MFVTLVESDNIPTIIGVLSDLSGRKRTEEALRKSEEKYRGLIEGMSEALFRISLPDGKYEYLSPSSELIFGYPYEELVSNPRQMRQAVHPDFYDYFKEIFKAIKKGDFPPTFEYKMIDFEGKERWILQSNKGIFDNQGRMIALEGLCRNITERKKAEEELRSVTAFLDLIVDNIPDMIFVEDAKDLRFVRFNRSGEEMTGYSRYEMLGKNYHDFFPKEQADLFTAHDLNVLRSAKVEDVQEESLQTRIKANASCTPGEFRSWTKRANPSTSWVFPRI